MAHKPTPQQQKVIDHGPRPLLVVAGAGAGKTTTMAQRVVSLVERGIAVPEQILGLTFTRKATENLRRKIRESLVQLRDSGQLTPDRREQLAQINTTVSTYDSYAGALVREYGLYLPEEPDSRIIGGAELYLRAWDIVNRYEGQLSAEQSVSTVTKKVVMLLQEMESNVVSSDQLREANDQWRRSILEEITGTNQTLEKFLSTLDQRDEYLDLVQHIYADLADNHLTTFAHTMSVAARLASEHPEVSAGERAKFTVVMLDEYQDTSHAQRVLLSSLFGGEQPMAVTAVGDPMQTIYGWRGASSKNLAEFVTDFPDVRGPATVLELTKSFRNPSTVLDLANATADVLLGPEHGDTPRPVSRLTPSTTGGDVQIGLFADAEEEAEFVASRFAQLYSAYTQQAQHEEHPDPFSGAVLVRKHKRVPLIIEALQRHGVPYVIHFSGGLLYLEEIRALVDVARVLVHPEDSTATLSLLLGPMVELSLADVRALAARANYLTRRGVEADQSPSPSKTAPLTTPEDILEKFTAQVDEIVSHFPEATVSLADALADLGPEENYSTHGYARLKDIAATLRHLRTVSLRKSISSLFHDIDEAFHVRTEVLAREDPGQLQAAGTIHLDAFYDVIAEYERIPGATVASFLDYLLAEADESGLELGEVHHSGDSVQILTVHAAKGLEFDHVAVIGAGRDDYPDDDTQRIATESFLSRPEMLLPELYGDAVEIPDTADATLSASALPFLDGTPVVGFSADTGKAADFTRFADRYKALLRKKEIRETVRLLYVAVTRSGGTLLFTAHRKWVNPQTLAVQETEPTAQLESSKKLVPKTNIRWAEPAPVTDVDSEGAEATSAHEPAEPPSALFPPVPSDTEDKPGSRLNGIGLVQSYRELLRQGEPLTGIQPFSQLDSDVEALIVERQRQASPVVDVNIGNQLAATELVAMRMDPQEFARRKRRPVPYKPNQFAKRGTALHEWIERHYSSPSLLDDLELPGLGEEVVSPAELEQLKEKFRASEWWDRVPIAVEEPFEIELAGRMIRGQIDAVFQTGDDSYQVVDWKSGKKPTGDEFRAVSYQLRIYQVAWARLISQRKGRVIPPENVSATFYYIRSGEAVTPAADGGDTLEQIFQGLSDPMDYSRA